MDTAMGYDGYAISDNHIYISFDGMRETKSKINHAIEEAKNQRDNISRAIESLQVSDNVLRGYGNDLAAIKNAISKGIDDLYRMSQHIDYVVRRFQEVDNECAKSFSKAGYEMQEMLGIARKSGLFEEFVGGLVSITIQAHKALGDILVDGAKDAANRIVDWYQDNKVVIGNILTIALETVAIAAAVATIAAGALTPVGWIVIGAGLIVSASNIIDSGVKIYNYQKTGQEKGFNLIEKGFQAVLGDQAGSDAYTVVSIASGVYNAGKGAVAIYKNGATIVKNLGKVGKSTVEIGKGVAKTFSATASTIASQAEKFYTSVKGFRSNAKIAKNILDGTDKLNDMGDAVMGTGSLANGNRYLNVEYSNVSRGIRNSEILTDAQQAQVYKHIEELGLNPDDFLISSHMSCYSVEWDKAFLGPNMFPASTRTTRSVLETMTPRAVIAHEAGHMITTRAGTAFEAGTLYDEVLASLTGRNLNGLNKFEKYQLLRDAAERAKIEGQKLRDIIHELGGK